MDNKIDYWWVFLLVCLAVTFCSPQNRPIIEQIKASCGPAHEQ